MSMRKRPMRGGEPVRQLELEVARGGAQGNGL